jgi:hypothetical protein
MMKEREEWEKKQAEEAKKNPELAKQLSEALPWPRSGHWGI